MHAETFGELDAEQLEAVAALVAWMDDDDQDPDAFPVDMADPVVFFAVVKLCRAELERRAAGEVCKACGRGRADDHHTVAAAFAKIRERAKMTTVELVLDILREEPTQLSAFVRMMVWAHAAELNDAGHGPTGWPDRTPRELMSDVSIGEAGALEHCERVEQRLAGMVDNAARRSRDAMGDDHG